MNQQSDVEAEETLMALRNCIEKRMSEREGIERLVDKLCANVRDVVRQNAEISDRNGSLKRCIRDLASGKDLKLPSHVQAVMSRKWAGGECNTNLAEMLAYVDNTIPRCEQAQQDLKDFHQNQQKDYNLGHFGKADLGTVTKVLENMKTAISKHPILSSGESGSSGDSQNGRADASDVVELLNTMQPTDQDFNRKCMAVTDFAEAVFSTLLQQDRATQPASQSFPKSSTQPSSGSLSSESFSNPGSTSLPSETRKGHDNSTPMAFRASAKQRTVQPSVSEAPRSTQHSERTLTSLAASTFLPSEAYFQQAPWQNPAAARQDNARFASELAAMISSGSLSRQSSSPQQPQQPQQWPRGWPSSAGMRAPLQPGLVVRSPQNPSVNDHVDPSASASTSLPRLDDSDGYTLFVRNIPARFTQADLLEMWPAANCYNLLYLPFSHEQRRTIGCATINFLSYEAAMMFRETWHGRALIPDSGAKKLDTSAAKTQGLTNNLALMRNSKKILRIKNPRYLPTIIQEDGTLGNFRQVLDNTRPLSTGSQTDASSDVATSDGYNA
jgi:hypothetical protein